jgi:lipase ATG15
MAYMSYNDYAEDNNNTHWIDLSPHWNTSSRFGWESDGIRGYVFSDPTGDVFIISFKGTSASFFGIGGTPTSAKDKYNVRHHIKLIIG